MKKITLTQNKYTLVDNSDFNELSKYKWYAKKSGRNFYAARTNKRGKKPSCIPMHSQILGKVPKGKEVDHKDGDTLNNQRKNLRIVSHAENMRNSRKYKNNSSGHRGVSWHKQHQKWYAQFVLNKKHYHLGYFKEVIKAAEAYNKFVEKFYQKLNKNN